jgi:hypothetical protein
MERRDASLSVFRWWSPSSISVLLHPLPLRISVYSLLTPFTLKGIYIVVCIQTESLCYSCFRYLSIERVRHYGQGCAVLFLPYLFRMWLGTIKCPFLVVPDGCDIADSGGHTWGLNLSHSALRVRLTILGISNDYLAKHYRLLGIYSIGVVYHNWERNTM